MTRLVIVPERLTTKYTAEHAFYLRWTELARAAGYEVEHIDPYAQEFLASLRGAAGLMWRINFAPVYLEFGRRLLLAVEHGMGIPVFPSTATVWHFEDKVAQRYLLEAAGIPIARTWVFWRLRQALAFLAGAAYPLVFKLNRGIKSRNVQLVRDRAEGERLARLMFGPGMPGRTQPSGRVHRLLGDRAIGLDLLRGRPLPAGHESGYLYLQEFLPDNAYDTRVTVIGERAFAFRRSNRPGDFRASGSGLIDWTPDAIDPVYLRLAFRIARTLRTQSVAIDGLRRGAEPVVGEISYSYAGWALLACPGHWRSAGGDPEGELVWVPGQLRPDDAIWDVFAAELARAD